MVLHPHARELGRNQCWLWVWQPPTQAPCPPAARPEVLWSVFLPTAIFATGRVTRPGLAPHPGPPGHHQSLLVLVLWCWPRSLPWATPPLKRQTHQKPGQQQEEVSFNSSLFPEERLCSSNHSNKLPATRLAIYSSHSGFSFLKGPVALHNIHSLSYHFWNILACFLLADLLFVYNLFTLCLIWKYEQSSSKIPYSMVI